MFTFIGVLLLTLSGFVFKAGNESDSFEFGVALSSGALILFVGGITALGYGLAPVFEQLH